MLMTCGRMKESLAKGLSWPTSIPVCSGPIQLWKTNIVAVLEAAGSGLDRVVKTTVYLADIQDWPAVNEVYAGAFGGHRPARSAIQAGALPLGARVEIDVVATV